MKKIVYLPLDERPCNYEFAAFLSENNREYTFVRPPYAALGEKKRAADHEKIEAFLCRECQSADYLIASVDMLLYGGIVPSRLHALSKAELEGRLDLLRRLKENNPALKIYAFSLIMRCPSYSSADEEPGYYETCGREIFLLGRITDTYRAGLIGTEEYEEKKTEYEKAVGGNLQDYLARRKINLSLVLKTLALVGGAIDKFIVPQDDSSPYGYTAIDQRKVKAFIGERGLDVDIYPGADEVGMTLLAAAVADMKQAAPSICPIYPKEECKNVIPLYEDREVYKSIAAQIKNAGARYTDDREHADILLFCNLPAGEMRNVSEQNSPAYAGRDLEAFTETMAAYIAKGRAVAAADLAYCNGGDKDWVKLISEKAGIFSLAGYAGWNTSSNSLGTVICQAVLYHFYGDTQTHRKFLAERVYEDVGYCGYVRKYMCDNILPELGYHYFDAGEKRGAVSEQAKKLLLRYIGGNFPEVAEKYTIASCIMPWKRMFEIGLTVEETDGRE